MSGLWGVVRGGDLVPDYRVPASGTVPGLGGVDRALARRRWRTAMPALVGDQPVLDLRSTDYRGMWRPGPELRGAGRGGAGAGRAGHRCAPQDDAGQLPREVGQGPGRAAPGGRAATAHRPDGGARRRRGSPGPAGRGSPRGRTGPSTWSGRCDLTVVRSRCVSNLDRRPAESRHRGWSPSAALRRAGCSPPARCRWAARARCWYAGRCRTGSCRTVGAWCFLDDYGPHDVAGTPGMQVPPHPHTGLQTVTWLLERRGAPPGQPRQRRSSSGPGELNLMTAGRGITHAETSPAGAVGALRGLQLWVALPARHRDTRAGVRAPRRPAAGRASTGVGHRAARVGRPARRRRRTRTRRSSARR